MEKSENIWNLAMHPSWSIHVNGEPICKYEADFIYVDALGIEHVEDAKGFRTREYILKKKLMKAVYGIEIAEV